MHGLHPARPAARPAPAAADRAAWPRRAGPARRCSRHRGRGASPPGAAADRAAWPEAVEAGQPVRHVPRDGVQPPRLGQGRAVHLAQPAAEAHVLRAAGQVAERRAEPVIRLAVLVDQPGHLARVAHRIGWELGADRQVHR